MLTTAALPPGSHTIQAKYNGDANFGSSTGTVAQTVNKATPPTTLASSLNPSTFNQNVTFTLTVTGATGFTPTGSVTFTDQTTGQTLGTRFLGSFGGITATAFVSVSTLVAESHTIQASYAGDTNFNGTTTSNGVDRARPASVLASLRASTAD